MATRFDGTFIPLWILFFDEQSRLSGWKVMKVENNPANPVTLYSSEKPTRFAMEISPKALPATALQKLKGSQLCVISSSSAPVSAPAAAPGR